MKSENAIPTPVGGQTSMLRAALYALPMLLLTPLLLTRGKFPHDPVGLIAFGATYALCNALFFAMLVTGKTDKYRAPLFIAYSGCFVISFVSHLIELRGTMALTESTMIEGGTPFCHIVIPMTLIPAALTKTIIFPGTIVGATASIAGMFVLWIGASLALGRGFCSWACFFGGLDEGFSRIMKRPFIKQINPKWRYFPYAVLLAIVLMSAMTLSPAYCEWLCPFKTVTEYAEITSVKILIQTMIFVSLFIGLVIVLPLLMKRRTQCGLFCPFGAFQSFTNKLSPIDVRIDREKCISCKKCAAVCPMFSLTEATIAEGKAGLTCAKCGKCIDACPRNAISYHVKGAPPAGARNWQRLLALYPAFLFLVTMSGHFVQDAIVRVVRLISTGSMI